MELPADEGVITCMKIEQKQNIPILHLHRSFFNIWENLGGCILNFI